MSFARSSPNFSGAYFRKVKSASGNFVGIRGRVRLPTPDFDATGWYKGDTRTPFHDHTACHLDCPSVYLGGNAGGQEVDAGLTWSRRWIHLGSDFTGTFTDRPMRCDEGHPESMFFRKSSSEILNGSGDVVAHGADEVTIRLATLRPNFAYRVFWRVQEWANPKPPGTEIDKYYYPGETVDIELRIVSVGVLRLSVISLDRDNSFVTEFDAAHFSPTLQASFKRVISIDQFFLAADCMRKGNEAKTVLPTRTRLRDAFWFTCDILKRNGQTAPVAGESFLEVPGTDTVSQYTEIFVIDHLGPDGQERLSIVPNPLTGTVRRVGTCPDVLDT